MNDVLSRLLGSLVGQVAGRIAINKIAARREGLGGLEPGRYPHPEFGPVIIPRGAEFDPERPGEAQPIPAGVPFQIAPWGFFVAYGALLYYAAKRTRVQELPPALAEADQLGVQFTEDPYLFPGLKRKLEPFEAEDVATSDDPVEACLQRRGWKLDRVDELKDSIAKKRNIDLFSQEEVELDASEAELMDDIEVCLQQLEKQHGSLEAAGVNIACSACSGIDDEEEENG